MIAPNKPPYSIDDEKSLLGCVLLDPRMLDEVATLVRPEHCFDSMNAGILELMLEHRDARKPVTPHAMVGELKRRFPADDVVAYLGKLAYRSPVANHAKFYAEKVRGYAKRRNWLDIAQKLASDACDSGVDVGDLDAKADRYCRDGLDFATAATSVTVGSGLAKLSQQILSGRYGDREGISTGLPRLDRCTGGLRPGQLITLAAPTGGNKSGFALSRMLSISTVLNRPTLYFSMEMTADEIEERALANLSGVPTSRFSNPSDGDRERIQQAADIYEDCPMYIVDKAMIRVSEIAAIARAMHWQHNFAAIVVDYVQQVEPDRPKDPRHQQVGYTTRVLKTLAMDLRVPIIALAQLNREYKGGRPTLANLRESGSIEQDSNMVWFLWMEDDGDSGDAFSQQNPQPEGDSKLTLTIGKNRSGPVGADIKLTIKKGQFRYEEDLDPIMAAREAEAAEVFDRFNRGEF